MNSSPDETAAAAPRPAWLRYSEAIGWAVAALIARVIVPAPVWFAAPYITFFPAAILSTWFGGLGPGLVTLGVSVLFADYFFVPPVHTLQIGNPSDTANLLRFIAATLVVIALTEALHSAQRQAQRTRRRLREQEQQEAVTLSSIGDGVITADQEGRITFMNPVAEKLTGWEASEAAGQSIESVFRIFNEATGEATENPIRKVIESGAIAGLANHTVLETKSGERIPIDDSGAPIRDSQGQVKGAVLVFRDITRQRKAAEELRKSQQQLTAILERISDGFVALDRQWRYTYVNEEAARQGRMNRADMLGKSIWDLFPQAVGTQFETQLRRAMAEQTPVTFETENPQYNQVFRLRVFPSADGISIFGVDISAERKEAATRAEMAAIVESSDDAIISEDLNGIIRTWNKGAERIFGYTEAEVVGKPISLLAAPGRSDESPHMLERIRRGERVDHFETLRQTKDGRVLDISLSLSPIRDSTGRIIGASKISRDITQQKAAEQALIRQAEQLARSNADLREFAYIASHDLQEPLRNIFTFTQLLAQRYSGKIDAEADTFMTYVADSALRMKRLIRDLLSYSQLIHSEDGELREVDLSEAVNSALGDLRSSIEESGAVVEMDALPSLRVNHSQMAQLFQNLISNAIKYRGSEAPRICISAAENDGQWVFSVRDNGIGIEPQYHDKIFGAFRRLHGSDYPGTGIGLSICKRIVEKHGGRIWVESEAGKGSVFQFSIAAKGGARWTDQAQ